MPACVFADCPEMTAVGLQYLGSLYQLEALILVGISPAAMTDAVLDSLNSCSRLRRLQLGDPRQPPESAVTPAAVSRSVSQLGQPVSQPARSAGQSAGQSVSEVIHTRTRNRTLAQRRYSCPYPVSIKVGSLYDFVEFMGKLPTSSSTSRTDLR